MKNPLKYELDMMIPIYIDGNRYVVKKSKNVLELCLSLGFDIPYFCWHPALGSVGSCRQCAVKCYNDNFKSEQLVMSCMTPVSKGMNIVLFDKEIKEFRKGILELLMINHPHDCPVCEEGGNCHLQDMTVMTGHAYRRYRFTKRTHRNQYLGPFIKHEMNRCITCYRCIRYYRDYAGGNDLGVFGVHDNIYFGRVSDGKLQSEFSGNLIEICPTGVFTDKTQSNNYTRKWDVIFAPSICQQCSVGCNIILGERYGKLCRVENRYNGNVNGYFLCDRGRFGCDYVNFDNRPIQALKKQSDNYVVINQSDAIQDVVNALNSSHRIIGIGSSRASIENNFALRNLVGSENFYSGVSRVEQEQLSLILKMLYSNDIYIPSVREIESYDAVLILGEDLTQTAARIALSVRQAIIGKSNQITRSAGIFDWQAIAVTNIVQDNKNPLLITSVDKTKLDDLAMLTYYDSVQNQARFGFAIAHALDNTAPAVKNFDLQLNDKLNMAVQKLLGSFKPLIISGIHSGNKDLIKAAINIARALKNCGKNVGITFVVRDVNSIGLSAMDNKNLDDALLSLCTNKQSISLIVLENDLYRYASAQKINQALNNVNYLLVLDHQQNLIQKKANLILPVSSFAESDGTVINYEGRAQRFFRLCNLEKDKHNSMVLEGWRWLYLIQDSYKNFSRKEVLNIDYVIDSIVRCFPNLSGIKCAAPKSDFRVFGQKIAQAPHRYSGRSSMYADLNIHEPCTFLNTETMFTNSMEGSYSKKTTNNQIAFVWDPGWNSPQAWNKFQDQIGEHLYPEDPGMLLFKSIKRTQLDNNQVLDWFSINPRSVIVNKNKSPNKWLIAPYWHLFGSDDLSSRVECIKNCMIEPYVILNKVDALELNIQKNMLVEFICDNRYFCFPVKFSVLLPSRHIGLPIGFPGIPVFFSGIFAKNIKRVLF